MPKTAAEVKTFPSSQMTPEIRTLISRAASEVPKGCKADHAGIHDAFGLVCSPFRVVANTCSADGLNYGLMLEIVTPDRRINTIILPREKLDSSPREAVGLLGSRGLQTYDTPQRVVKIIKTWRIAEDITVLDRAGWTPDHLSYAFRDGRIVRASGVPDTLRLASPTPRQKRGTFEGWRDEVSTLCRGNPYSVFAVSAAFAAPLMARCNVAPGLFHFHGESSIGKSTLLRKAASVWTYYEELPSWNATSNGLEALLHPANHGLQVLDELNLEPHEGFGDDIYMLMNGSGKARATKIGDLQQRRTWNVGILSSGEKDSHRILERAFGEVKGGQSVRFIDIHIRDYGTGAFDDLHGHESGGAFSDHVRRGIENHSGHAAEVFIKGTLRWSRSELTDWFDGYRAAFISKLREDITATSYGGDLSDPKVRRVLSLFALVSVAGQLARSIGIVAWDAKDAEDAALLVAKRWLMGRNAPDAEDVAVVDTFRAYLASSLDRFTDLGNDAPLATGTLGWKDETFFYLTDKGMEAASSGLAGRSSVPATLLRMGLLERGSERDSMKTRISIGPKKRVRVYRISSSILDAN